MALREEQKSETQQNKNMIVGNSFCFVPKTWLHRVIIFLCNNKTKIYFQIIFLEEYLIYVKLLKMCMRFEKQFVLYVLIIFNRQYQTSGLGF